MSKTEQPNSDMRSHTTEHEKVRVWMRLNQEVVDHFRKGGRNWHQNANDVLDDYVKKNS